MKEGEHAKTRRLPVLFLYDNSTSSNPLGLVRCVGWLLALKREILLACFCVQQKKIAGCTYCEFGHDGAA